MTCNINDNNKICLKIFDELDNKLNNNIDYIQEQLNIIKNTYLEITKFDLISIYGLDDYHLLKKLEDLNYQNIVFCDIFVIHPKSKNLKYDKWKYNMISNILTKNAPKYERQLEENINILNDLF